MWFHFLSNVSCASTLFSPDTNLLNNGQLHSRYIYKPSDRSDFAIMESRRNHVDTIKDWKSLRCLTATEAAWKCIIKQMHFRQPCAEGKNFMRSLIHSSAHMYYWTCTKQNCHHTYPTTFNNSKQHGVDAYHRHPWLTTFTNNVCCLLYTSPSPRD